jgi:hypothetical protein
MIQKHRRIAFNTVHRKNVIFWLVVCRVIDYCSVGGKMPRTAILVYQRSDNVIPIKEWLDDLEDNEPRAFAKCLAKILLLAEKGNELRRPNADILRDGIYELRTKVGTVNYRILYFFCGSNIVCLSHGFRKEGVIPASEIDDAVKRKKLVKKDINRYTAHWEV